MKKRIPSIFKPILWSYDINRIDPDRQGQLLISQAINYGDLPHWRWIVDRYGKKKVLRTLQESRSGSIRPAAKRLAKLLLR